MSEIVVVQGYAGSGKSTHSQRLSQHTYNDKPVAHVSAGARLRAIRTGLEPSKYADFINHPDASSPLPDEVVNGAIFEQVNPARHGLTLFDGYPRHESGVEVFANALREGRHCLRGCICLEVTQEVSTSRILIRGERIGEVIRGNSLAELALKRYAADATQTQASVARLGELAPVERVDANAGIDEVRQRFFSAMGRLGIVLDGMPG